jgi:uncharacterized membrane protein
MPLAVSFYSSMTAIHIMSVVAAFGVLLAAPVLGPGPGLQRAWMRLLTPAAVLVLLTGAYLASDSDAWSEPWVSGPLTILFVVLGLVHAVVVPAERKIAAGDTAAHGRWRAAVLVSAVLVLVAIYLMTTKLGG